MRTSVRVGLIVAAFLIGAGLLVIGFPALDRWAHADATGFDLTKISTGAAYDWTTFPADAGGYLAGHLILDAILIVAYGAGFALAGGCFARFSPASARTVWVLLGLAVLADVTEDVLLASHHSLPWLSLTKFALLIVLLAASVAGTVISIVRRRRDHAIS